MERQLAEPPTEDSSYPSPSNTPPVWKPASFLLQEFRLDPPAYLSPSPPLLCTCLSSATKFPNGARQDSDPSDRQLHEPAGDFLEAAERDLQEGQGAGYPLRCWGWPRHLLQHRPPLWVRQHQVNGFHSISSVSFIVFFYHFLPTTDQLLRYRLHGCFIG